MSTSQLLLTMRPDMNEVESDLADKVADALRNTGYVQLSDLNVRVDRYDIHLQGHLPSYYLKQVAHYVVLRVPGVQMLVDDIQIGG